MKKVSIIIPNYNNDKYIRRCLDSILEQGYSEKEVIVVDGSSTDNSIKIIREYAKKNNCIKFYTTNHVGPNVARKLGLEKSSGEYIMFVDSDDFLKAGAIETLVEKIENNNVDIVRFESERCSDKKRVAPILKNDETEKIIYHDEIIELLSTGFKLTSLWSKIYSKTLFGDLSVFDTDLSVGEDLLASVEILNNVDKILVIPDVLYGYRDDNTCSLTHNVDKQQIIKNIHDRIYVSCKMLEYINKNISNQRIKTYAIYEQLRTIWEAMKRLSLLKKYTRKEFQTDFAKDFANLDLPKVDFEELSQYVRKMKILDKLKNANAILVIAKNDVNGVWKNFLRYKMLNKIVRRGK